MFYNSIFNINFFSFFHNFDTLFIFYLANIITVMVIIFLESKKPSSSWAWILVLLLIPHFGLLLYLIFGRPIYRDKIFPFTKEQKIKFQQYIFKRKSPFSLYNNEYITFHHKSLIELNFRSDQAFLTTKNDVKIITTGGEKFKLLFEDIEKATNYIYIQYYILKKDNIGKKLFSLLKKKLKEGVKVYILYDDIGSRTLNKISLNSINRLGAFTKSFFKSSLPLINFRLNYRNHRKIVVIDGKIGYIGGYNVGDEYLGNNKKFGPWRDIHLRIRGEAVALLNLRFIDDWNSQINNNDFKDEKIENYGESEFENIDSNIPIQVVTSGPDEQIDQIKYGFLHMIKSARKYIYIQSPYFIPDEGVMDSLKMAILSGTKVKIMIPKKSDHPFVRWANYYNVGKLVKLGAKIYEYEKGFLHSKLVIIDDEVTSVGSANFDNRSFKLNFEINTFIYDDQICKKFRSIFDEDIKNSSLLTKKIYDQRSTITKIKEAISRLISPIL